MPSLDVKGLSSGSSPVCVITPNMSVSFSGRSTPQRVLIFLLRTTGSEQPALF
jgi:hypothetical protein